MKKGEFDEKIQILWEMLEVIETAGSGVLSAGIKADTIVQEDEQAIQILLSGDDPNVMYALANALGVPVVESGYKGEYLCLTVCTEDAEICLLTTKANAG